MRFMVNRFLAAQSLSLVVETAEAFRRSMPRRRSNRADGFDGSTPRKSSHRHLAHRRQDILSSAQIRLGRRGRRRGFFSLEQSFYGIWPIAEAANFAQTLSDDQPRDRLRDQPPRTPRYRPRSTRAPNRECFNVQKGVIRARACAHLPILLAKNMRKDHPVIARRRCQAPRHRLCP